MEIHSSTGCGNSPKNRRVEDFAAALLSGSTHYIQHMMSSKGIFIVHSAAGERVYSDTSSVLADLPNGVNLIRFEDSISHGKAGSTYGFLETSTEKLVFSIHIRFSSVKADSISRVMIFITSRV